MSILDLQGLDVREPNGGGGGGGGGSTVTLLGCDSKTPSNVSLALCH